MATFTRINPEMLTASFDSVYTIAFVNRFLTKVFFSIVRTMVEKFSFQFLREWIITTYIINRVTSNTL